MKPAPKPKASAQKQPAAASTPAIVKTIICATLLIASGWLLGYACGQIENKYLTLLLLGPDLAQIGLLTLASIVSISLATGLVVTLVRPYWMILVALALTSLALVAGWGITPTIGIAGLLFFAVTVSYAHSVIHKFNNQINFSLHPLFEAEKIMVLILALIISAAFTLGYLNDSAKRNFVIVPEYKEGANKYLLDEFQKLAGKEGKLKEEQIAAATKEMRDKVEKIWTDVEKEIKPYAREVGLAAGMLLFFTISTTLMLLGWIPLLLLGLIIKLLEFTHVTRTVTEMREVKRLTLS